MSAQTQLNGLYPPHGRQVIRCLAGRQMDQSVHFADFRYSFLCSAWCSWINNPWIRQLYTLIDSLRQDYSNLQ